MQSHKIDENLQFHFRRKYWIRIHLWLYAKNSICGFMIYCYENAIGQEGKSRILPIEKPRNFEGVIIVGICCRTKCCCWPLPAVNLSSNLHQTDLSSPHSPLMKLLYDNICHIDPLSRTKQAPWIFLLAKHLINQSYIFTILWESLNIHYCDRCI